MKYIKAIPTKYNKVNFKSRLEARWAVFFDQMGYGWKYEPFECKSPCGTVSYLPDFIIMLQSSIFTEIRTPNGDRFKTSWLVEIKPKIPNVQYLKRISKTVRSKMEPLVIICGYPEVKRDPFIDKDVLDVEIITLGNASEGYASKHSLYLHESNSNMVDASEVAMNYRFDL